MPLPISFGVGTAHRIEKSRRSLIVTPPSRSTFATNEP